MRFWLSSLVFSKRFALSLRLLGKRAFRLIVLVFSSSLFLNFSEKRFRFIGFINKGLLAIFSWVLFKDIGLIAKESLNLSREIWKLESFFAISSVFINLMGFFSIISLFSLISLRISDFRVFKTYMNFHLLAFFSWILAIIEKSLDIFWWFLNKNWIIFDVFKGIL